MKWKTDEKEFVGILVYKISIKVGLSRYDSRMIVAQSVADAIKIITPYLCEQEEIVSVEKMDLNIWIKK